MATIKASNQLDLIDLTDGYTIMLSNESHTFAGDADSVSATQTITTQVMAMQGNDQVSCSVGDITAPAGVSVVSDGKTPWPILTITATSALIKEGLFEIPIIIGDLTFTKVFSYAIAFKGATGQTGAQGAQGLQGPEGKQGIQGPAGPTGKASYTHIAYSTSADGTTGFSQDPAGATYIGMYVDNTEADSDDPTKYGWSKIQGPTGPSGATGAAGTPGKAGADGKTPYFHVAYANSADGKTDFSATDSTNKTYMGQYTDYTEADNTDPAKYAWTLIKGPAGAQGAAGAAGKDALTLVIISSAGTIFKNTAVATTMTAHIYKGGVEVTGDALKALGTITWYKDGGTTAVGTGQTLEVKAGDVDSKANYTAQLVG